MCLCMCECVLWWWGWGIPYGDIALLQPGRQVCMCTVKIIRIVVMTTVVCYGVGDDEHIKVGREVE